MRTPLWRTAVIAMIIGNVAALHADTGAPVTVATNAPTSSDLELQARVTEAKTSLEVVQQHIMALQSRARISRDVLKLTCVDDKAILGKAQGNVVEMTSSALDSALAANADTRFGLADQLKQQVAELGKIQEEANGCVGDDLVPPTSEAQYTAPLLDDPSQIDALMVNSIEAPGYASPFR